MGVHLTVGWLLLATPQLNVDPSLGPRDEIRAVARVAWQDLERLFRNATGQGPSVHLPTIQISQLSGARAVRFGASRFGRIEIRFPRGPKLSDASRIALRHELAHQFLWAACPAAQADQLFHEAFAVATSGEQDLWTAGAYLSTPQALRQLQRTGTLDSPPSRRALARLLAEGRAPGRPLPPVLLRRLRLCAAGARWIEPLTVAELGAPANPSAEAALIALDRHSGEVLRAEGAAHLPMPYGSTLKPFVLSGAAARPPTLLPDRRRAEWWCQDPLPVQMDGATALVRSCNGYFLDWASQTPDVARFGAWGPILVRLGLGRLPLDMSETIGIRPTLALSPWALAQAYRILAAAQPEVLAIMKDNVVRGTLSGLPVSARLRGMATKTGTVRDARSRPLLGWIVAVDADRVVVKTVPGRAPRTFAADLVADLERIRAPGGQGPVSVQTFGLLSPWQIEARCAGLPVSWGDSVAIHESTFFPLVRFLEQGPAMCVGAPWMIRFPGTPPTGRAYAGVFNKDALPPLPAVSPGKITPRQQRARRGSDIIFRTSLQRYVSGVLAAEDARIEGEARIALGRVIAHNATHSRHPGRPVCDTTHCQVFLGTQAAHHGDPQIYEGLPLPQKGWLLFSRGGSEPWRMVRPRAEVESILGQRPVGIVVDQGRLIYRRTVVNGDEVYDEPAELPCDLLRVPLRLPSCPERVEPGPGAQFTFWGRGQGHGQGLDVEWAKKSGQSAEQILQRAY